MLQSVVAATCPPVQGDVHDVGVAIQNLFDAVPMVHVPVQDEYLWLEAQEIISSRCGTVHRLAAARTSI